MRNKRIIWIVMLCFLFLTGCSDKDGETLLFSGESEQLTAEEDGEEADGEEEEIYAYICGSVKNPGVYALQEGGRVYELVELAGGFTKKADTESVNLAEIVTDGEMIDIPTTAETSEDSKDADADGTDSADAADGEEAADADLVNINTADLTELMTLSGIGEVKAQAIIDYRSSSGAFEAIEDIMNVSGIAEGTYANIKDFICV